MPMRPPVLRRVNAMRLHELTDAELERRLQGPDALRLQTGPFVFALRSPLPEVAAGLRLHYGHHPVFSAAEKPFCDFHIAVRQPRGLRRWLRPQCVFHFDGAKPFEPLPGHQGFAMLEWGLNWSISMHAHQYLVLHAAVLERHGRALILPAPPGSGKSTLCAALALRGWRLLSDELALIQAKDTTVLGLARPVSLKNRSIAVIQAFEPKAVFGAPIPETSKGLVCHLQPSAQAVERMHEGALPGWIVLPRYEAGAPTQFRPLPRADVFLALHSNSFNVQLWGHDGFRLLGDWVAGSQGYELHYSRLEEAIERIDAMAATPPLGQGGAP